MTYNDTFESQVLDVCPETGGYGKTQPRIDMLVGLTVA